MRLPIMIRFRGLQKRLQQGLKLGIEVVPGVEISTVANGQDIHVLGYYIKLMMNNFFRRLGVFAGNERYPQ